MNECMTVTLDTSYFDRSPLNDVAVMNMQDMMIKLEYIHTYTKIHTHIHIYTTS